MGISIANSWLFVPTCLWENPLITMKPSCLRLVDLPACFQKRGGTDVLHGLTLACFHSPSAIEIYSQMGTLGTLCHQFPHTQFPKPSQYCYFLYLKQINGDFWRLPRVSALTLKVNLDHWMVVIDSDLPAWVMSCLEL
jgi:hypothetical protein